MDPQLLTPTSHSNSPSLNNSISPATPPNYKGNSAKTFSSTGSSKYWTILHHHITMYTPKSSSPIPTHMKTQIFIDTKHTLSKKISTAHQHATSVKSNTIYIYSPAHPCGRSGQPCPVPEVRSETTKFWLSEFIDIGQKLEVWGWNLVIRWRI